MLQALQIGFAGSKFGQPVFQHGAETALGQGGLPIAKTEWQQGAGHAVLLTDARGVILNCVTEQAEKRTFEQAGLWLGADWSEACEGTNGIGTCLVERQPLTIHQNEHFRSRHTGLTCSASPVFDPHGELLAVLDVSSARHDVSRQSQFHTMALVNLSAKAIEGCHFLRSYEGEWLLRFHAQAEYIGQFSEGLLAFDGDGRVSAVNQSAINLLGLSERPVVPRSAFLGQVATFAGDFNPSGWAEAAGQLLQRHCGADASCQGWLWLLTDGRSLEQPAAPSAADHIVIVNFDDPVRPLGRCPAWATAWGAELRQPGTP